MEPWSKRKKKVNQQLGSSFPQDNWLFVVWKHTSIQCVNWWNHEKTWDVFSLGPNWFLNTLLCQSWHLIIFFHYHDILVVVWRCNDCSKCNTVGNRGLAWKRRRQWAPPLLCVCVCDLMDRFDGLCSTAERDVWSSNGRLVDVVSLQLG